MRYDVFVALVAEYKSTKDCIIAINKPVMGSTPMNSAN